MIEIHEKYKYRFQKAYENILDAYLHIEKNRPPIVIQDVNYWLSGFSNAGIPNDYFTNFKSMLDYQIKKIEVHLQTFDDDYIPLLFPWYGTGVVPSALGCKVSFRDQMDPTTQAKVNFEATDIKKLEVPDPYKDGLMPEVLGCIDFMRTHSDLPVSITDCQGPLSIALSLCGAEKLFLWMFDYPRLVHELMDFCTETLIQWVKIQKKHAGQTLTSGAFPHSIILPKGFGGIWISDDDCTTISPQLYKEFVVPYNAKVFDAFGGGTLHFCGNAEHQLSNFVSTKGLTGINNFCMGNFRQIVKMQEMFEDKIAIMICDFTPLNIEEYYTDLCSFLKFKGVIIATYPAPELALYKGKYESVTRDVNQVAKEAWNVFDKLFISRGKSSFEQK